MLQRFPYILIGVRADGSQHCLFSAEAMTFVEVCRVRDELIANGGCEDYTTLRIVRVRSKGRSAVKWSDR